MFHVTIAGRRFTAEHFTLRLCGNEVRLNGQRIPQDANRPFVLLLEAEPARGHSVTGVLPTCQLTTP